MFSPRQLYSLSFSFGLLSLAELYLVLHVSLSMARARRKLYKLKAIAVSSSNSSKTAVLLTLAGVFSCFLSVLIFCNAQIHIIPRTTILSGIKLRRPSNTPLHKSMCLKEKRIAFVKVHKAAGSTVTSILQRYGVNNNLTFALPKNDLFHIGLYETFDPQNVIALREGMVYDVLCQHVVYNREAFREYLPPDIALVASVRDPFQRALSAFRYFPSYLENVKTKFFQNATVQSELMKKYFQNPPKLLKTVFLRGMWVYLQNPDNYEPMAYRQGSMVLNRMSFDLGLPKEQYDNPAFVEQYIRMLDHEMSFVIVKEYFDLSLVLLKRLMCWSTSDILYHVKNQREPMIRRGTEEIRALHRQRAPSEYQIYEFFKSKLLQTVEKEDTIHEEVQVFRNTLRLVWSFCRQEMDSLVVPPNRFDKGFNFTRNDCYLLTLSEPDFISYLIKDHRDRGILQD